MSESEYVEVKQIAGMFLHLDEEASASTANGGSEGKKEQPELINIYQVQGEQNSELCTIMKVGVAEKDKVPYVLIKTVDLSAKIRCMLVSCFYTEDSLKSSIVNNNLRATLVELVINSNTGTNVVPIAYIKFNFVSESELKTSTKTSIHKLNGSYTITLHYGTKYLVLKKFDKYPGKKKMIDNMLEFLFDEFVLETLSKIKM